MLYIVSTITVLQGYTSQQRVQLEADATLKMGVMEVMRRALASISAYDRNFGPLRDDERDFTLLFEHTILTMIPTIFMIIAAPFYVRYYSRRPVLVERGILYWLKTVSQAFVL